MSYDVVKEAEALLETVRGDLPHLRGDPNTLRLVITKEQRNLLCRALLCLAYTNDKGAKTVSVREG